MTKCDKALKRVEKAKKEFDSLPELTADEKELCLQYINNIGTAESDQHLLYGGTMPKIKAIGSYHKRTGCGLKVAKERIEVYIQSYMRQL